MGFIHIIECVRMYLVLDIITEYYSTSRTHSRFIHSSADELVGTHVLLVSNGAVLNVSWCDLVWTCVFIAPGQTDMQEGKSRVVTLFPVHGTTGLFPKGLCGLAFPLTTRKSFIALIF